MRALEGVLTVSEAAAALKVHRQTVYRLIYNGDLRPFKIGSSTRLRARDVYALVGLNDDKREAADAL